MMQESIEMTFKTDNKDFLPYISSLRSTEDSKFCELLCRLENRVYIILGDAFTRGDNDCSSYVISEATDANGNWDIDLPKDDIDEFILLNCDQDYWDALYKISGIGYNDTIVRRIRNRMNEKRVKDRLFNEISKMTENYIDNLILALEGFRNISI